MRVLNETHIHDLHKALTNRGDLDPITVVALEEDGKRILVVVDGHHRLEAYKASKQHDTIPYRILKGGIKEALVEAGLGNTKAKLPTTNMERMNYAWRLVRLNAENEVKLTAKEIASTASISERNVFNMRKTYKETDEVGRELEQWWQVLQHIQGKEQVMLSHEAMEEWLDLQAAKYSERLGKQFGDKLSGNPEMFARVIHRHSGRGAVSVYEGLGGLVGEELQELADAEEEFDVPF